jgi:hypothetical protein
MTSRESSAAVTPAGRGRSVLFYLLPAAVLSVAVGLLVVADARLASYHPLWQLVLPYEVARDYLWTTTAFALLLAVALAAAHRDRLFHHRYLVAAVLLLATPALGGLDVGRVGPTDLAAVLVTLFWILSVLGEGRPVLVPRVVIALLLGLAICALGSITAGGPGIILAMPAIISKLVVLFLAATLITTPAEHRAAIRALIAVALISACIAVVTVAVYLLTGFVFTLDDRVDEHFKCLGWICMLRATALTPAPQVLGHLLILGMALALFLPVRRWILLLVALMLLAGGVSTLSVGVLLALGVVLALFPIFRWPWFFPHILISYLAVAWLAFVSGIGGWAYGFANEKLLASYGVDIRIWTYIRGAELVQDHPVFGIGVLREIPGSMHFSTPHNAYLQIALQMGLPAATLFIALLLYLFGSSWRIAARSADAEARHWMRALMLALTGIMIHFLSEPLYTNNLPWAYMGLITAGIVIYRSAAAGARCGPVGASWPRLQRVSRTLLNRGYRT